MSQAALKLEMTEESRFGFPLPHGTFHEDYGRSGYPIERGSHSLLQGARLKAEDLLERLFEGAERDAGLPAERIESPLGCASGFVEPSTQVRAVVRGPEREPVLVRADPVGETCQTRQQHELRSGERCFGGRCRRRENFQ